MAPHVRVIAKLPDDLFESLQAEVTSIDWNNLPVPDRRKANPVFSSCDTLHLRVHNIPLGTPQTVAAHSEILDCIDTRARPLFPVLNKVVDWTLKQIEGTQTGRIMLVRMSPGGHVPSHVDPGTYFRSYYRFHVPVITNPGVVFSGPEGTVPMHMPQGYLCQLLNCNLHGVENSSDQPRIHLIADLASDLDSFKYTISQNDAPGYEVQQN